VRATHHHPVVNAIVQVTLLEEAVTEELAQVRIVGLVSESQRTRVVQVRGKLGCERNRVRE